jgi:tetratricopeptide (TPR) repeat protein
MLQQGVRRGLGALLMSLLAACSSLRLTPPIPEPPADIPQSVELKDTPFFPQERYHCGPAALATLLNQRQVTVTPETLSERSYLPEREGSLQVELTATARHYGMLVYPISGQFNDLLREVAAGNPVMILQNQAFRWFPRWHYAVVVGYDLPDKAVVMRSGRERRWITDFQTFMNTWQRADYWGIVTLPPGGMPATARERPYLSAAHDLESTHQKSAAYQAYQAAVQRWPESAMAWLTLGNSAYGEKAWSQAVQAFQQAVKIAPQNSAAWNNLAYALLADQRDEEALRAITHALTLAPDDTNLLASEREIRQRIGSRATPSPSH